MSMRRCPWSERELEAVEAAADGLSVIEIAERLMVTTHTVKTHLRKAGRKVGYEGSRAGLVGMALREGWIE
jgi:DNA-binding NarL/FixJ family response regulator